MARKEYEATVEGLMAFLRDKSRERGGGHYWKVIHKGLLKQTIWGRSAKDVIEFLKAQRVPYTSIQEIR